LNDGKIEFIHKLGSTKYFEFRRKSSPSYMFSLGEVLLAIYTRKEGEKEAFPSSLYSKDLTALINKMLDKKGDLSAAKILKMDFVKEYMLGEKN
jgi:hypothetical protein